MAMAEYIALVAGPTEYLKSQIEDNANNQSHCVINQKLAVSLTFDNNVANEVLILPVVSDIPLNIQRLKLKGYTVSKESYVLISTVGGDTMSINFEPLLMKPLESLLMAFTSYPLNGVALNIPDVCSKSMYYHPIFYKSIIQNESVHRNVDDVFDTKARENFLSFYVENDYTDLVAAGTDFTVWIAAVNLLIGVAGYTFTSYNIVYNIAAYYAKLDE